MRLLASCVLLVAITGAGACLFPSLGPLEGDAAPSEAGPDVLASDATRDASTDAQTDVVFTGKGVSLTAGSNFTCAIRSDGGTVCWGGDVYGQLGNGVLLDAATPTTTPVPALVANAVAVAAGESYACAILEDQTAECWGLNNTGQLGTGVTGFSDPTPQPVLNLTKVTSIAGGNVHSCASVSSGQVFCWGDNSYGQLGTGNVIPILTATTPVIGITDALAVACGAYFSCAVHATGGVSCWGRGESGELGNGNFVDGGTPMPVSVSTLAGSVAIAAYNEHVCALTDAGTVSCWGANDYGDLTGVGGPSSATPLLVGGGTISDFTGVSVGLYHACGPRASGGVSCWGYDGTGQLGNNTSGIGDVTPGAVYNLLAATVTATGGAHSCALTPDGHAWCWGTNTNGQLGDGNTTGTLTPVAVTSF